jgi:drug/metabolite transporter (DMT)-like permease
MADGGSTGATVTDRVGREVDYRAFAYLGLMVLIGSTTATAAKFAVQGLPPAFLPLVRFGGAGLCLLPLVARRGEFQRMLREDGWRLATAALLCVPVNQTFFLNGTRLAPTSHVAIIYAACPLVVLLLAWATGQERLVRSRLVGVAASTLGVAAIGLDSLWRGGAVGQATLRGDLLLIGAVGSWGAYLITSKRLIGRYGPLPALAGTFLTGAALHVPVALATLPSWPPLGSASAQAWRGLAYLTLVVSVVGLTFQNLAMRRLEASQVATFGNAAPLLTVLWGVWLFGETVTPALALGGVLTLGGIVGATRPAPASEG